MMVTILVTTPQLLERAPANMPLFSQGIFVWSIKYSDKFPIRYIFFAVLKEPAFHVHEKTVNCVVSARVLHFAAVKFPAFERSYSFTMINNGFTIFFPFQITYIVLQ